MGRSPCWDENGIKKGSWTPEEDRKLVDYITKHGHGNWRALPMLAGLERCGKSCRLRWTNYLRPGIKRGKFSKKEEQTIMHLHSLLGNKWSTIASHLPGRTDNEIKNFWNTRLRKKLIQMGLDPMTHRPRTDVFGSLNNLIALANLENLIGKSPFQQEAMELQVQALQLANSQQLHEHILQSNPMDIQTLNSSNSFQQNMSTQGFQNQALISPTENANSQLLVNNPLSLEPQTPLNLESPLNNNQTNTNLFPSSSCFPLPMSESATSLSNVGDAETASASNHGGGEFMPLDWTNFLFEEPFLHEYCYM